MIITFEKLPQTAAEIGAYSLDTPFMTAALFACAMCAYDPKAPEAALEMLKVLIGEAQTLSRMDEDFIRDRMTQNGKYPYLGKSYFMGATAQNDYTPSIPYQIEVKDDAYSYTQENFASLLLQSGGADSPRRLTLRKMKDSRWVVWSNTYAGLLADIRTPESKNPWA